MEESKGTPKTADWAPGTLDRTRRAIGNIDPAEAAAMSRVLGGEVMYERSPERAKTPQKNTGRIVRPAQSSGGASAQEQKAEPPNPRKRPEALPAISAKLAMKLDKLMMSDEYHIKPDYGLFNFIKRFQKNGTEQILPDFCSITLKLYIDNMESFITVIKTLIQIAPASYKAKIAGGLEPKFKFLRMVAGWKMQGIKLAYVGLQELAPPLVVSDLVPYVREVYKLLIQVYYYGETKIPKLIKEIYTDETKYPEAPAEQLSGLAKQAITTWLYLQNEIIRKLYPLLMRMCTDSFEPYPEFFTKKVVDILKFTGMHKFDLLIPEKPAAEEQPEKEQPKKKTLIVKGVRDSVVDTGLSLLDQFFPQAGFKNLERHPDLYPYFQPLYRFADGFNVLSPENPLQVTVVLLRIIEDLFQGCRNIQFVDETPPDSQKKASDSMSQIINEWASYREVIFEKLYCGPLNNLVNQIYSQGDFGTSQFGKKLYTSLLWQTNYHFLPNFKFEQLLLERPADESKMRPLFLRTDFVRTYLTEAVNRCSAAAKTKGSVGCVQNPWDHYKFEITNECSKRLDVLLGGGNTGGTTNATNANLLKYTLCVVSVLDWWLNNPDSPAYATPPMNIFRVSMEDGKPVFSVEERSDQNKLFAEAVKAAYARRS